MRPLLLLACAAALGAQAQYNLIPQPRSIDTVASGRVAPAAVVRDTLPCPADSLLEAYTLLITPEEVRIQAYTPQGFVWADRTLEQLRAADGLLPQVSIADSPEFPLRGFMYDTGRNFIEVEQLEQMIDLCSRYKLNAFHWHLTDHPAWRIECRAYPQLNDKRYQRIGRDEGRYYSYADIRHIIDYARERGMMVIPEIDMPGHSTYFPATFGFAMNSPEGMAVLADCLEEFFAEFSAEDFPIIHIGSDEIHIDNPEEFMAWAVGMVESHGRTPMVWDPGLQAGDGALYQVWRDGSANPEAIPEGKRVVDSYMGYLNYGDPLIFTNRMYMHKPCITGRGSDATPGGILCLWNDVRVVDNTRIEPHSGMMGGVLPFAERFWRGGEPDEPLADVLRPATDPDMQRLAEFHDRMLWHKERLLPAELAYWQPNRPSIEWDLTLADSLGQPIYQGNAYGDVVDFDAIIAKRGLSGVASATISREVECEADTTLMCRIGFDAPARSNRLSDGIALQGKWENYGRVEVNGEEVLPPVWLQPGLYRYHYNTWARPEEELPYTDEQLYWMRSPVEVPLRKGANKITLSTRKHFPGQRFQAAFLDFFN